MLTDSSKAKDVVTALTASQDKLGIQTILAGDPASRSSTPPPATRAPRTSW
jgi:hypothetical protein